MLPYQSKRILVEAIRFMDGECPEYALADGDIQDANRISELSCQSPFTIIAVEFHGDCK